MPDSEYSEMMEYVASGWGGGPSKPMVMVPWAEQWPRRQKRARVGARLLIVQAGTWATVRWLHEWDIIQLRLARA